MVEYVLAMPVQRFFALRNAIKRNEAKENIERVRIAATPAYMPEYAQELEHRYSSVAYKTADEEPEYADPKEVKELLSGIGR